MNRLISLLLAAGGLVVFPLADSAIKGMIVLLLAGLVCLVLRRDSAATRHFVWTMAVCLLIFMPVLSLLLPAWRILPPWLQSEIPVIVASTSTSIAPMEVPSPELIGPEGSDLRPLILDDVPVSGMRQLPGTTSSQGPASSPADTEYRPANTGRSPIPWATWLSGLWFAGCVLLVLRLTAAAVLLRRAARRSVVVADGSPASGMRQLPGTTSLQRPASLPADAAYRPADTGRSPDWVPFQRLHAALAQAMVSLELKRPVQMLLDPHRSIPIVWGLFKTRLQLPAEAVHWTGEQLQSVLLHELAHVRRRDLFVLALTQVACALYWFNPLVWVVSWRLHVERERACDDLVLASGVRASAYAEHLLNVATRLTSSPWTQACGLAMARNSSLHGRLTAVLSEKQNRRRMTTMITFVSLAIAGTISVPIAMLQAASLQADEQEATDSAKTTDPEMTELSALTEFDGSEDWTKMQTLPVFALCSESMIWFYEQHLDWSEPVNGLRASLSIRTTSAKGVLGNERKILIVLQNVSDQPIRFCDTAIHETDTPAADVEGRKLYLEKSGEIMAATQNAKSTNTDLVLQPRHMLSLDMFDNEQGHKRGDSLAEGIVKDSTRELIAILNIAHAPQGAWTGSLATPSTRGAFAAEAPLPRCKEGQALFRYCIDHARLDGKIPGGLISRLHDLVQEFIDLNSGDEYGDAYAKKMQPLLAKFERKGDWKQFDVVVLFEDIAAISTIPLERTMDVIRENTLQRGQPLPASLNDANWGEALPGGLRVAWILEPQAENQHVGSALKSHVVIHNSGTEPVMFVTRSFHQPDHNAVTASGATVQVESTFWTTIGRPEPFCLHPGESCEVHAPGIGIGRPNKELEDWSNVRAGSWILANEGEDINFQPGEILLTGDHNGKVDPDWWLKFMTERINRDTPLPDDAKEREVILFRVISDLFGNSPTPEEADAFLADTSPQAVDHLAKMLSERTWQTSVAGPIKSGEIKFHVLPEDPEAATGPRVATNPGRYNLSDEMRFVVTRQSIGERIINEAEIVWYPPGKDSVTTNVPLPDGYDTWAAGWLPETTIFWVSQAGLLRSYDFTDHAAVKETRYEGDQSTTAPIPATLDAALRSATAVKENSKAEPRQPPGPPAATKDDNAAVNVPIGQPVSNIIPRRSLHPNNAPAVGQLNLANDGVDPLKIGAMSPGFKLVAEPGRKETEQAAEKFRTATRGGEYDLGNGRTLRIDTRNDDKQSFTVLWKETAGSDGYQLNVVPKYKEPTSADLAKIRMAPEVPVRAGIGRPTIGWGMFWEPGSPIVWIAESRSIGKLDITDPVQVIWTRHNRLSFSTNVDIPDDVRSRFHTLSSFESMVQLKLWSRVILPDEEQATVQTLTATKLPR